MGFSRDSGLWAQFLRRIVGGAMDRMEEVRQSVQRGAKVVLGCPECGTRYSVREKDAGRGVKCPKCNVILPVGGTAGADGEHPAPAPKPAPPASGVSASLTETLVSKGRPTDEEPLPGHLALTLTVLEGPDTGNRITLARTRTILGRRDAHVLLNDPEVSGLHAAIAVDGSRYSIRDLRSTNGTFLNGKRIEEAQLAHLDEVRLGRTTLLFTVTRNTP
ncbi:MAG: FHA domain-containing protein [candidate division NC10 bacterium]|nr:FHA domain-containing protein [candidate division NC10 bacterium]